MSFEPLSCLRMVPGWQQPSKDSDTKEPSVTLRATEASQGDEIWGWLLSGILQSVAAGAAACLRLSFTSLVAPAGASPGQHGSPTPEPASAAFLQRVAGQLLGLGRPTASDSCAAKPGAKVALPLQSQKPQLRRQARREGYLGHIPSPRQSAAVKQMFWSCSL